MAIKRIDIGAAPILWSNVKPAFDIVNDNFQELYDSIGLNTLEFNTDIIPKDDNTYTLGTADFIWASVFTDDVYTNHVNIGTGTLTIVNGELTYIDSAGNELPTKFTQAFKEIDVVGQPLITADYDDTLTISAEIGIDISTVRASKTIHITNTGIINIVPNTEISVVTDPVSRNTEIILNNPNKFNQVNVSDVGWLTANTSSDILRIDDGYGIVLTTDELSNRITISIDPEVDIYGNVYGDDSVPIVNTTTSTITADSIYGTLYGEVEGIVNGTIYGDVYGSVFGADSTPIVDAYSGILNGSLYGSVYADDSTILVDAINGTISWYVISDAPYFVEKTSDQGSAIIPAGTDAERDISPSAGFVRFNSTRVVFEGYNGYEWVPFDRDQEYIVEFSTPGNYTFDVFSGNAYQSAEYKIQAKAIEGIQVSTFVVLFGGTPETTFSTEYGQILSHDTVISEFSVEADVNNNITLSCNILFPNTKLVFRRTALTNA